MRAEAVVIEIESDQFRKAGVKIARRRRPVSRRWTRSVLKSRFGISGARQGTEGLEGAIGSREIEVYKHAAKVEYQGLVTRGGCRPLFHPVLSGTGRGLGEHQENRAQHGQPGGRNQVNGGPPFPWAEPVTTEK